MQQNLDAAFDHAQTLVVRMQGLADRKIDAAPDELPALVEQHVASLREIEPAFTALARVLQQAGLSDRLSVLAASVDPQVSDRAVRLMSSLEAAHFSHAVSSSVLKRKVNLARAMALAAQGLDQNLVTATLPGASRFAGSVDRSRNIGQA
ncbi:hypothetical protein BH10PSE17_BH10PSE17_22910 [soil metagenome]